MEYHVLIIYLGGYIGRFYFRSWSIMYLLLILEVILRGFISDRGESFTYYLSWWLYWDVFFSGRGASCTYYLSWWLYREVLFQVVERHVLITYLGGYIERFYFRSWRIMYLLFILVVITRSFISGRGACGEPCSLLIIYLGGYIGRFYFRSWSIMYLLLILVVILRGFISGLEESCTYYLSWWLY